MSKFAIIAALALAAGGCAARPAELPPAVASSTSQSTVGVVTVRCASAKVSIRFDFDGAPASNCTVDGERAFTLVIAPEHAPPINPSPWYAFRYRAEAGGDVKVRLVYRGAQHRYPPLWNDGAVERQLKAEVAADGSTATIWLPPADATVSAQRLLTASHYAAALSRWARVPSSERLTLGRSYDGRPVEAVRLGRSDAPQLLILLGRQHPPEVSGAVAMEAFVDRLAEMMTADPGLSTRLQILIVPLLNPDGVARGHWRANRGGVDLNRDWGRFTQPETQSVKLWLDALPAAVRPVAMIDFHSTRTNLFYVQGDEAGPRGAAFLRAWLSGKEKRDPGYTFTIEPRNANPGSGTAKNWFFERYTIPAYTYEVADDANPAATTGAARGLAPDLVAALNTLP